MGKILQILIILTKYQTYIYMHYQLQNIILKRISKQQYIYGQKSQGSLKTMHSTKDKLSTNKSIFCNSYFKMSPCK